MLRPNFRNTKIINPCSWALQGLIAHIVGVGGDGKESSVFVLLLDVPAVNKESIWQM